MFSTEVSYIKVVFSFAPDLSKFCAKKNDKMKAICVETFSLLDLFWRFITNLDVNVAPLVFAVPYLCRTLLSAAKYSAYLFETKGVSSTGN